MSAARVKLHGTLAEYGEPGHLVAAVKRARAAGFTRFETYTPCPVEGLDGLLLPRPSPIPGIMLTGAAAGASFGFGLQAWATSDYPLEVAGRPVFSWPSFIPVTFELGVLTAVITGIVTFFWRAGLPRYHHALFASPRFARATSDRFFLCLEAADPRYSEAAVADVLAPTAPLSVEEVPA